MHYYKDGKLVDPGTLGAYPSVTTILAIRDKPYLRQWREAIGPEAADARQSSSAALGTAVHSLCESIINGLPVSPSPEELPFVQGFIHWREKFQPNNMVAEIFLESHALGYAGTADLVCMIDGDPWIVDFKTSKKINPEYALQLAAYKEAYEESKPVSVRRAVLQLTDKTQRGYRWHPYDAEQDFNDFGIFMAHKNIFDWIERTKPAERPAAPIWEP